MGYNIVSHMIIGHAVMPKLCAGTLFPKESSLIHLLQYSIYFRMLGLRMQLALLIIPNLVLAILQLTYLDGQPGNEGCYGPTMQL